MEEDDFFAPRKRKRPNATAYLDDPGFDLIDDLEAPIKTKREKKSKAEKKSLAKKDKSNKAAKEAPAKEIEAEKQMSDAGVLDIPECSVESPFENLLKEKKKARQKKEVSKKKKSKDKSFALASDDDTVAIEALILKNEKIVSDGEKSGSQPSLSDTLIASESQESLNLSATSCDENNSPLGNQRRDQFLINRGRLKMTEEKESNLKTMIDKTSGASSGLTLMTENLDIGSSSSKVSSLVGLETPELRCDYSDKVPNLCSNRSFNSSNTSEDKSSSLLLKNISKKSFDQFGRRNFRLGLSRSTKTLTPLHKNMKISQF